jgi:hypothetical protein
VTVVADISCLRTARLTKYLSTNTAMVSTPK